MKMALVMALTARPVEAVLTEGATVLLDSVYINAWDPGYSNCPHGVVDGKLYPRGLDA